MYVGKTVTISSVEGNYYRIKEYAWNWTDEMIEGLVEDEIIDLTSIVMETVEEKTIQNTLTYGYNLPEGYQFVDENGNVINATKIVLEKKKKEYPKTYEECCEVLGINSENFLSIRNVHRYDGEEETIKYERDLLDKFDYLWQLIICRDAYWKIAGEEMGLGKPWEPDWSKNEKKYTIEFKLDYIHRSMSWVDSCILTFPSEELRDVFYENFKKEIEICKELL